MYNPSIVEIIQIGKVLNHKGARIKLIEFGWSCYIVWQICFVRADRPSLISSDEWGPIGPYETDLSDYVAGSIKFNKF